MLQSRTPFVALTSLLCAAASVAAAPVQSDGEYLSWSATDGISPTFAVVPTEASGTRAPVTTGTIDGRTAVRIHDNSDTNWVAFNHTLAAENHPDAAPRDHDYVTRIELRLDGATAVSGRPLLYRERDQALARNLGELQLNANRNLVWVGDPTVAVAAKDAGTGQTYVLPTDQWVTITLHRTSATEYHLYVNDGVERDLGVLTATPEVGAGTVQFIQFGTGLGVSHKADIAFASFDIGEAVPEPGSVGLLSVGVWMLAFGRAGR